MPTTSTAIAHLVVASGYPTLALVVFLGAVGVPLPLTAALALLGAFSARPGGPNVLTLGGVILGASCAGSWVDYGIGRFGGQAIVMRVLCRLRSRSTFLSFPSLLSRKRLGWLVLLSRFVLTPIAAPVSLLAGVTRFGFVPFFVLDVGGKALYVGGYLALGYLFGESLQTRSPAMIALLVGVLLLVFGVFVSRRRATRATLEPGVQVEHRESEPCQPPISAGRND